MFSYCEPNFMEKLFWEVTYQYFYKYLNTRAKYRYTSIVIKFKYLLGQLKPINLIESGKLVWSRKLRNFQVPIPMC